MKRVKNLPLLVAILLIGVAGFGFFAIIESVRNDEKILVAKGDLSAYSYVNKNSFEVIEVPKAAIEGDDNILTEADYDAKYVVNGADLGTYLSYPFLQGQWILEEGLVSLDGSSVAAVLEGERVVSTSTTITGAGLGSIKAGDVVTVTGGGDQFGGGVGTPVDFVKVMCITPSPAGCPDLQIGSPLIVPADDTAQGGQAQQAGSIYLLLAVPENVAPDLAGGQVSMVLNPFCRVSRDGYFESTGKGNGCKPSGGNADREAFKKLLAKDSEPESESGASAGASGVTPTSPDTTTTGQN